MAPTNKQTSPTIPTKAPTIAPNATNLNGPGPPDHLDIFETNIKEEDYNIINICPFEETFMASNNNKYKHIYYIGQVKDVNINPYGEVASLIVTLTSRLPKL